MFTSHSSIFRRRLPGQQDPLLWDLAGFATAVARLNHQHQHQQPQVNSSQRQH
jgi:hypothetical protein